MVNTAWSGEDPEAPTYWGGKGRLRAWGRGRDVGSACGATNSWSLRTRGPGEGQGWQWWMMTLPKTRGDQDITPDSLGKLGATHQGVAKGHLSWRPGDSMWISPAWVSPSPTHTLLPLCKVASFPPHRCPLEKKPGEERNSKDGVNPKQAYLEETEPSQTVWQASQRHRLLLP